METGNTIQSTFQFPPPSPLHDLIKENKTINTINSKTPIIHRRKYNFICKHNLETNETAGFQSRDAEGPRDESCQLKACQLPRNSAETNCTTSPGPSTSCRYLNRATKSCCRHRLMICAINYSGLASELGGIIDLVDRRRPSLLRSERPPFSS